MRSDFSLNNKLRLEKPETLKVKSVVDAICVWVHGCDPRRLSDGSRLALHQ